MAYVDYPAMHVSTSTFEAQLVALKELYRIVPMTELHGILCGSAPLRERLAIVTFDDGYRDNYQNALPILERQSVPATFFLSVDFVDGGQSFWFDRLAEMVRAWPISPRREALRAHLPRPLVAALDLRAADAERARQAVAHLKSLEDGERRRVLSALEPVLATAAGAQPLRWRDVRAMQEAGMRIGAHGMSHSILTRMHPEAARQEMARSLELLGSRLGTEVCEFAYPNGDADERVAQLAQQAGVRLGFTIQPRELRSGEDLMRLGRRNVCEDTSRGLFGKFSRAYFFCEATGVFDRVLRRAARAR
jgi:peptidoglycan/xylan/chitin deacetylase (PgdA/CDA1 family)